LCFGGGRRGGSCERLREEEEELGLGFVVVERKDARR